jgi:hypothetical protein
MESNDYQLALLKERNEWQHEKSTLRHQVEEVRQELAQTKQMNEELTERLAQTEKQSSAKIQSAREEEWSKMRAIETEKRDVRKFKCNDGIHDVKD